MICPNCGAEYPDEAVRCPHCQSENERIVQKRKKEVLNAFDREAEQLKTELPRKKVQKISTVIWIVLAGLVVMILFGLLFGTVWTKYSAKIKYTNTKRHIAQMEELLENEKYQEFFKYADQIDLWESSYLKYKQIYDVGERRLRWMYQEYETYCGYLEREEEWLTDTEREKYMVLYMTDVLEDAADTLQLTKQYIYDRVILGNEKLLQEWENALLSFLETELGMSPEDVEELRKYEGKDETVLQTMAEEIAERDLEKR